MSLPSKLHAYLVMKPILWQLDVTLKLLLWMHTFSQLLFQEFLTFHWIAKGRAMRTHFVVETGWSWGTSQLSESLVLFDMILVLLLGAGGNDSSTALSRSGITLSRRPSMLSRCCCWWCCCWWCCCWWCCCWWCCCWWCFWSALSRLVSWFSRLWSELSCLESVLSDLLESALWWVLSEFLKVTSCDLLCLVFAFGFTSSWDRLFPVSWGSVRVIALLHFLLIINK